MEEPNQTHLAQRITRELTHPQPDPRRDHLAPSPFQQPHNHSNYRTSFSPLPSSGSPTTPAIDKQLQQFRKHENSTSQLSGLPSILEGSHYQQAFQAHSQEKQVRGKEKESWFLKMNWALDPASNYQVPPLPLRRNSCRRMPPSSIKKTGNA